MRRIFFFLMLFCLGATTIAVFAANKKFANTLNLYVETSPGNFMQVSNSAQSFLELEIATGGATQSQISGRNGIPLPLYHDNGSSKVEVTSVSNW